MISIKSNDEIALLKIAGSIVHDTRMYLLPFIKEGITTKELDKLAEDYILSRGATPSFKGYNGYPSSICTSINEEVAHALPSKRKLRNGDIISIDIGVCFRGVHADSAWTYPVGEVSSKREMIMKCTKEALFSGINAIKPGSHIGDISHAISKISKKYHLSIVKEVSGHGIGKELHEEPDILNYGIEGSGEELMEGMVLAIEPVLAVGRGDVEMVDDWTMETVDNSSTAHYEHTVLVTSDGYEILTGGIDG